MSELLTPDQERDLEAFTRGFKAGQNKPPTRCPMSGWLNFATDEAIRAQWVRKRDALVLEAMKAKLASMSAEALGAMVLRNIASGASGPTINAISEAFKRAS